MVRINFKYNSTMNKSAVKIVWGGAQSHLVKQRVGNSCSLSSLDSRLVRNGCQPPIQTSLELVNSPWLDVPQSPGDKVEQLGPLDWEAGLSGSPDRSRGCGIEWRDNYQPSSPRVLICADLVSFNIALEDFPDENDPVPNPTNFNLT